ncbi:MAG: acyltransferase [Lachnospiraceae bacterium]|nr:acyltransferase [Lachnospiraceae bacterium]MBP5255389.1 acyltransferase [Lachnospiraceae bacterium]
MNEQERYDNLDGLRAVSCLAIAAMHIRANAAFDLAPWARTMVGSWTHFVYLFLMISGFGMFCGYYERFRDGKADVNAFYRKRYAKILPFFGLLILADLIIERSVPHLIEGLTELTLVFGLLPNNSMEVIGVGWTIGIIFLFYMLFPFFVFLCWSRKRAWFSFAVSILLCVACSLYFFTDRFVIEGFAPRHSFLYCAPYFLSGGLVYLYRNEIRTFVSRFRWPCLGVCVLVTVLYYVWLRTRISMDDPGPWMLAVFLPWLVYAVGAKSAVLSNPVMKFLSGISLEIYLAHMVVFRAFEKLDILYFAGNGPLGFAALWAAVVGLLILCILAYRWVYGLVSARVRKMKERG